MRSGMKKFKGKNWKGKLRAMLAPHSRKLARHSRRCQNLMMKLAAIFFVTLFSGFALFSTASAQTPAPEPLKSDVPQLEALAKKIDEQNAKIDALSQEILKLEQQISHIRPGVMIGEKENTPSSPAAAAPGESASHPINGTTHTVARGETLTAIAKMYKVTIDELQKANHIEDGRKLQAGQTIIVPTSPSPAPSASPTD
jgi:LysM repeat protein